MQQMSELLAVPGIEIIGLLPEEGQRVTIIAAAVTTNALLVEEAKALIKLIQGPKAAQELEASGFGPIGS